MNIQNKKWQRFSDLLIENRFTKKVSQALFDEFGENSVNSFIKSVTEKQLISSLSTKRKGQDILLAPDNIKTLLNLIKSFESNKTNTTSILQTLLNKNETFIKLKITTPEQLHKALRNKISFKDHLSKSELTLIYAFDSLSKVFSPEVSGVFINAGITDLQALLDLPTKEVNAMLAHHKLDQDSVKQTLIMIDNLHQEDSIDGINGLTLYIKDLDKDQINSLKKVGIETLRDWALKRPKDIDNKVASRIDAYARLSQLNIERGVLEAMVDKAGVKSLYQLNLLTKKELEIIAKNAGIDKGDIFTAAIQAKERNFTNQKILMQAKAANSGSSGSSNIPDNITIDWGNYINECENCLDELSIFSCLAYLIYLIKLTKKPLTDLRDTLGLDFPNINADSISQIAENPQIGCEQITVCEQMTRALHDYLGELENKSKFEYEDYSYLSLQNWKANKMALHYPELNALWRDDVLTGEIGSLSNGSFLQNPTRTRNYLFDQLSNVKRSLETVRVFYINSNQQDFAVTVSPSEFNNAVLFEQAHHDYYNDFLNGLEVIKRVLLADKAISEANKMHNIDDAGNSIFHLHQAIDHLAVMSELTFNSASNWNYLHSINPTPFQAIIELSPQQRRETCKQLFNDLMTGEKQLFSLRNKDIIIDGLSDNGQVSLSPSWIIRGAFRDSDGRLEKYSSSNSVSFVKYAKSEPPEDYSRFTNYQLSADLTLDTTLTDGQVIALCAHWETNHDNRLPKKGYLLAITQTTEGRDGGGFAEDGWWDAIEDFLGEEDVITTTQHVSLLKARENNEGRIEYEQLTDPVQIGFSSQGSGIGSSTDSDYYILNVDRIYPMSLSLVGSNITGKLKISENRTIVLEAIDNVYPSGTFGFFGSEQSEFTFDNIKFEIEAVSGGFPPFHSRRRTSNRNKLDKKVYQEHRTLGSKMAINSLADIELTSTAENRTLLSLAGLRRVDSDKFITLLFDEDTPMINLNVLDDLLEHCLSAAFYIHYAVIPVKLAQAYTTQGNYEQAINHLKLVYDDYTSNESLREMYPYLTQIANVFTPIPGADEKLMRLRLGEIYLKQAELLFRQNTPNSKYEAKQLFERVLLLHNEKNHCECDERLGEVVETVLKNIFDFQDIIARKHIVRFITLLNQIYQSSESLDYGAIFNQYLTEKMSSEELENALLNIRENIKKTENDYHKEISSHTTFSALEENSRRLVEEVEIKTLTLKNQTAIKNRANQNKKSANYYGLNNISIPLIEYLDLSLCIPQNPYILAQTKQACLMLDLIENCLNILGFKDNLIPSQRFEHLFSLASSFTDASFNAERDVLNFRKLLEDNVQQFMQVENNAALSVANLSLESLNIENALGDIKLVELQKSQTEFSRDHFDQLISNGLSGYEELALNASKATVLFSGIAAAGGIISAAATAIGAGTTAYSAATLNPATAVPGLALSALGITGTLLGGAQGLASFSSSISNLASMQASFERREEEWRYNLGINEIGVDIANQTVQQAFKRLEIVHRQHEIAQMRVEFAKDTLSFLEHKFLNKEMLLWMLRLSRDQYRLRLNYAIALSFMAERAIAFELLSPALKIIRFDYFQPNRDGLLGATQLQTDLKTLQITKLNVEKRKLQISKTLSLAQLLPSELQTFKSTGVLSFSTLLPWFDKDFPGHYQRVIKRLSISILALVPPIQGIHAMLHNSGLSNVVTGPPYSSFFEKQTVTRNPEAIALTSAIASTGLINLEYQHEFLVPFEGLGVETEWILEMPQASNHFDFNTIADIYFTIEYTALHSDEYADDVRDALGKKDTNDTPLTPRLQNPDEWYHFKNDPPDSNDLRKLSLPFLAEFLPPHYEKDSSSIKHVTVIISGDFEDIAEDKLLAAIKIKHKYIDKSTPPQEKILQVSFETKDFNKENQYVFLSTRDSNDISHEVSDEINPIGEWEVSIKDTYALTANTNISLGERITDVLLIITTEGDVNWG